MENLSNIVFNIVSSYSDLGKNRRQDNNIIEKIKSFSNLQAGWDFGQGVTPSDYVISVALQLYNLGIMQGFEMSARPEVNGGIIIGFSIEDDFVYVTAKRDGSFDLVHEYGFGAVYDIVKDEENVPLEFITQTLKNVKVKWFLSEHYISTSMIQEAGGFLATPSKTWEEESPFSKKGVQEKSATALYVTI
jgi:hypothetical protein